MVVFSIALHFETGYADRLRFSSDLITTSAPSAPANHLIEFTTVAAVPAGGQISITFQSGLDIPTTTDYLDVDFSYATTATSVASSFVDRSLSTSTSATQDAVSFTYGSSSPALDITLNSTEGIPSAATVRIELGTSATHEGAGDTQLINQSQPGLNLLSIITRNASLTPIDSNIAAIYIIDQVGVGAERFDNQSPLVSVVYPSLDELLQGGISSVEMALIANEPATCKYGTVASTSYALLPFTFDAVQEAGTSTHTSLLASTTASTTYEFFVRCQDFNGNTNATDTIIRFTVGVEVLPGQGGGSSSGTASTTVPGSSSSSSGGSSTSGGGSSGSSGGGGSDDDDDLDPDDGGDFLEQSNITLKGWSYPGSKVTILQDGTEVSTVNANSSEGTFEVEIEDLERGTYTFGVYSEDSDGRKSGTYTTTIALRASTLTTISNIVVPPTVSVDPTSVDPGETVTISGYAAVDSVITTLIQKLGNTSVLAITKASTTPDSSGEWSIEFPTTEIEHRYL